MSDDVVRELLAMSQRMGVAPRDVLGPMFYETAGTLNPRMPGPKDAYGVPRSGLIQWGTDERKKYGVPEDMNPVGQMQAVERYLIDRGVKPGMGVRDIYSAINAGRVGLYNRTDAHNGGAPGSVDDKINKQMGPHFQKADAMLNDYYRRNGIEPPASSPAPAAPVAAAPMSGRGTVTVRPYQAPTTAAASPAAAPQSTGVDTEALTKLLQTIQQEEQVKPQALIEIPHPEQEYMRKAKLAQLALQRQFGDQ